MEGGAYIGHYCTLDEGRYMYREKERERERKRESLD